MTPRRPTDDHIISHVIRVQRACQHVMTRPTRGLPLGIVDTCACGKTHYELRWANDDGSQREWRYVKDRRP